MLSPAAEKLIHDYFNLPFAGVLGARAPYYNNRRQGARGQLRALSGKGAPAEIVEEAKIISIQYRHGLFDHLGHCCLCGEKDGGTEAADKIRHFLVDNNLGVDCSGFVTHALNAHFRETKNIKNLARTFYKGPAGILRRLINYLRPVENTGVRTYADDKNTLEIKNIKEVKPADVIIMMDVDKPVKHNHILLVTEADGQKIKYAEARAWSADGQYGHGVSRGEIHITNPGAGLLAQEWVEDGYKDENNETYLKAKNAKRLEVRRVKIL